MSAVAELAPPVQLGGWVEGAVGSATICERYGCDSARLITWERSGWIAPTKPRRGQGYRLWWSPAAQRMAAFIAMENKRQSSLSGSPPLARSQLYCQTWAALQESPTAIWFVLISDALVPLWTGHSLARLLTRAPGVCRTVVSPPILA